MFNMYEKTTKDLTTLDVLVGCICTSAFDICKKHVLTNVVIFEVDAI